MILAFLHVTFYCIQSASIVQELGTIYLSPNEIFQDNLYNYFDGEFLKFSLNPENSSYAQIEGGYNLTSMDLYHLKEIKDSHSTILSTFIVDGVCLIISANGLNVTIFSLSLSTGQTTYIRSKVIHSALSNARISNGIIQDYTIFLVVTGDELINGFEFQANEFFYILINIFFPILKVHNWDLKYVKNLNLDMAIRSQIIFWGNLYGFGSFFYTKFNYDTLTVVQQISKCFKPNSTESVPIVINDLIMLHNAVIILQKGQGILVYIKNDDLYFQNNSRALKDFGELYRFSKFSLQLNSLFNFGVTTSTGIVFIEYKTYRIKLFIPKNISPGTVCQVFAPYIFIFTSSDVEIYYFQGYNVSTLHKIPFGQLQGNVEVVENFIGFSVISQNITAIEVFFLGFGNFEISVAGIGNYSVIVEAEDENSKAQSCIYIKTIEDLYDIYMINNYRASNFSKQKIFFDSLNSSSELKIFDIVSGWELSVNLIENQDGLFNYNFSMTNPYIILLNNTLTSQYFSGCYMDALYLINNSGVYIEENLLINISGPMNIISGLDQLQVLYPGKLLYYNIRSKAISNITLSSNCSRVFKFISGYTLCVDSEYLYIIDNYRNYRLRSFAYLSFTYNETIIDAALYEETLVGSCFIYLLTKSRVLYCLYETSDLLIFDEVYVNGSFIIAYEPYLFLIDSEVRVFNNELSTLLRTIPLPSTPTSVFNIYYTLYMQIGETIYMINGNTPIIESLSAIIPAKACQVFPSVSSVLVLCQDSAQVYSDDCLKYCQSKYSINFFIQNPLNITNGTTELTTTSHISSKSSNLSLNSYFKLYTYSLILIFNYTDLDNTTFFIDYNKERAISLNNYFEGFDLEYELYVNNSIIKDPSFPLQLKQRVVDFTYFNSTEYIFIDHDIIPYTEIILILCNDSILIMPNWVPITETIPYNLQILEKIPQSEYFNQNGSCTSINYVSTKGSFSLFVLNCHQLAEYGYFYMNENITKVAAAEFIVVLEFDIEQLLVSRSYSHGINHFINWAKIVTSSNSCFAILAIDVINEQALLFSINNNLMVYSVCWKKEIVLTHLATINFCKLKLPRMQVVSVDGLYLATSDCSIEGTLYLYISDLFYGLRVLRIHNKKLVLQSNIVYSNDRVISIALCGNLVFSLSQLGFIDIFFIKGSHSLAFYQTMQPASNNLFEGASSYFSCSSYYKPQYLAVYLISKTEEFYQLRLIDIKSQSFTTYFKFIDLPINGRSFEYKAKSVFLNDSVFTVLGVNSGEFFTYLLSDIVFVLSSMNASEYESLIRQYKTDSFEVHIGYSNRYLKKNSTKFTIGWIGPGEKDSDKDYSNESWWIFVVASAVLVLVTLVSFVIYKKVIGKKNKIRQEELNSIHLLRMDRKVRLSMIHHEDTLK